MKSVFLPRMVNGPFGDPVLYVRLREERGALLFDLGDIARLTPSEIMRITTVFVSHTHIDHFIGFDHLLRIVLGRDKRIRLFGPRGFIQRVRGKLSGYTWNLVEDYRLELEVTEISPRSLKKRLFSCRRRFRHEEEVESGPLPGHIVDTPTYTVRAAILDHRTPCIAYALEEKMHVNINKECLEKNGYMIGSWLSSLKKQYALGQMNSSLDVPTRNGGKVKRSIGRLINDIASTSPGKKIVYVTDIVDSVRNSQKVVALAEGADVFYCEAAFLDRDSDRALGTRHLTARQAGRLAGLAQAARLEVFHFSPRYQGEEALVVREARDEHRKFKKKWKSGSD